jgi:hypothetical protein
VRTNAMAAVRALQDQKLMAQSKHSNLQSRPSPEAGWYEKKQRNEEDKHGHFSLFAGLRRVVVLEIGNDFRSGIRRDGLAEGLDHFVDLGFPGGD